MKRLLVSVAAGLLGTGAARAGDAAPSPAAPSSAAAATAALSADKAAAAFGAREGIDAAAISPDGRHAIYVAPDGGRGTAAVVVDLEKGEAKQVQVADGKPMKLACCGWSMLYGMGFVDGTRVTYTRVAAFDADGGHAIALARPASGDALRPRQSDGGIIDWLRRTIWRSCCRSPRALPIATRTASARPC